MKGHWKSAGPDLGIQERQNHQATGRWQLSLSGGGRGSRLPPSPVTGPLPRRDLLNILSVSSGEMQDLPLGGISFPVPL